MENESVLPPIPVNVSVTAKADFGDNLFVVLTFALVFSLLLVAFVYYKK